MVALVRGSPAPDASMAERTNVIVGAGLAGLTAAYTFQQAGDETWLVLEKEDRPGGHARSIELDGYVFDFGPHILFSANEAMERLIRDLLGENLRSQERRALIYHAAHDLHTRFPFQAHLYGLPVQIVRDCLAGLVRAVELRASGRFSPSNYEEWMRGFFGDGIAERLMIPYARKLWTVEPATMDFDWIDRRVPTPEIERILLGALTDDVEEFGATAHFWYPWHGGIESLARALSERVTGIEVGREVSRIDLDRRVLSLRDGDDIAFGELLLTLPLQAIPTWIPDVPADVAAACANLEYQGIFNVNLGIDRPHLTDAHWVYFYEDAFPFHRLSFPGNFSPHNVPPGKSSVATEVAFSRHRELDTEAVLSQTIDGLRAARIVSTEDEIELVHHQEIAPAYVIYDLEHRRNVATIRSWLEQQGVWTAGRFGEWGYLNMDHAMKSGQATAEAILTRRAR
jgi:protoporphyrinogen oxidase